MSCNRTSDVNECSEWQPTPHKENTWCCHSALECLLMPRESHTTNTHHLVLQVVQQRKQKAQRGNAHGQEQRLTEEGASVQGHRQGCDDAHQYMSGEEWVMNSVAGAAEEIRSTWQLAAKSKAEEVLKRFWGSLLQYVYIIWETEKLHMLPARTLPDCQLYLQMMCCRSIYHLRPKEADKITTAL